MMGAKIYGVVATITGAVTTTVAAAPDSKAVAETVAPLFIPYIGNVPIFAVGVGALTALLVRVVETISSPKKMMSYNIAVTGITMIGSITYIIDHQISAGNSFWVGISFGGAGFGVVTAARSSLFQAIFEGARAGFLKGAAGPKTSDKTE